MDISSLVANTQRTKASSIQNTPINWASLSQRANNIIGDIRILPGYTMPTFMPDVWGGTGSSGTGTGSVTYRPWIEEITFNGANDFYWGFISDSPDGYSAYFFADHSDDVNIWVDFQVMNDSGQWVSPGQIISGGSDGSSSITLRYFSTFNYNQGPYRVARITAGYNASTMIFTSQVQAGINMYLDLPAQSVW